MAGRSEASLKLDERRKYWHNLVMRGYWRGEHTIHRLRYHVVWIPKYRKRVLRGKIAKRLRELMYQACRMNRWWVEELAIPIDHVHVLIQIKPKESLSDVIQVLKGGTSRVLRKEFPELEEFLWGDSFWADGYFAETIGRVDEETIKKYIERQA